MTQRLALILCIAGLVACALVTCARAGTCFADAEGVWRHGAGAHASWTLRMPGHKGERCYFAAAKGDLRWHASGVTRDAGKSSRRNTVPSSAPSSSAPGAAPSGSAAGAAASSTRGSKIESEVMPNELGPRRRGGGPGARTHDDEPRPALPPAGAATPPDPAQLRADWDAYFGEASFWGAIDKAQMFREFEAWRSLRSR